MARNRVIYQSEALFVSQAYNSTGILQHEQLRRVQSANYSASVAREDINEFGLLGRIDSLVLEAPTVNFDFTYYATDGFNERAMGFLVGSGAVSGGFASGHLVTDSGRNFYVATTDEGADLSDGALSATDSVIGIGNGFLSDYTLEAAVGSFPTVTVSLEALNMRSDTSAGTGAAISHPAIVPQSGTSLTDAVRLPVASGATGASHISALRPGDVTVSFGSFETDTTGQVVDLGGADGARLQSVSLSVPLARTALEQLGSKFAFARVIDFPVTATLTVNALVNEITEKNLVDLVDDPKERDITLTLNKSNGTPAMIWTMKGCVLADQSFSSAIGSNKSVDLTFTTQIGGPTDALHNVYLSGASQEATFA